MGDREPKWVPSPTGFLRRPKKKSSSPGGNFSVRKKAGLQKTKGGTLVSGPNPIKKSAQEEGTLLQKEEEYMGEITLFGRTMGGNCCGEPPWGK